MINNQILASSFVLMGNVAEDELDMAVALEQLGSVLNKMQYEKAFGNLDDVISKEEFTFSDTTGIKTNDMSDWGHPIYLEFGGVGIEECPVGMLEIYAQAGQQRVAFWEDAVSGVRYMQLSIPQVGILKVWYEPDVAQSTDEGATVEFRDSLRYCIATRHAAACLPYVRYKDEFKMLNKPVLYELLSRQAREWTDVYTELMNRIGTNRPFSRVPFMAGVIEE